MSTTKLGPEDGTNNRLYHITAEGYEHEYLRIAPDTFWIAISPAELRGTITQVGSEYQLTDLNGTVTSFDVTTGHWNSTKDRWGNTISGTYTSGQLTTISDSEGRQITLAYTSGQVTITLPNSKTWTVTLTGALLTGVRDPLHPSSNWRTYSYVNDHAAVQRLLSSITDDAGKELEGHTYDNVAGTGTDRGLTSSQAGGTRSNVTISYNDAGNTRTVTHTIDGSTSQTTTVNVAYTGARWLPTQISGNCATCGGSNSDLQILTYDYSNHVIDRKDGSGADQVDTQYTFDGNGMLLTRTDAIATTTYTYAQGTPAGFLKAWPSFVTSVTENSVVKTSPQLTKTTTYAWASSGTCAGATAETCLQTTSTGYLLSGDAGTTQYQTTAKFDAKHRQTEVDGPELVGGSSANRKTTYAYFTDAATNNGGRLQTTSLFTSTTAHLDTGYDLYDAYGTATKITDPNSVETDKTTDDRGRVLTVVSKKPSDPNEPADYTTTYTFDSRDRLTDVALPAGNKLHYDYEDGTNRLLDTVRVDSTGNQQERLLLTLNVIGDKVQEDAQSCSSPANPCLAGNWMTKRTESFKYDTHNRLIEVDHPIPVGSKIVYGYDTRANLISVQDENHASANTTYVYDARNRLTTVTQTLAGAPAVSTGCTASAGQIATCYAYDTQDNLTSVTDPNANQTTYTYDDFRRLQKQISPVSGTTTYSYDAAGNLTSSTDANSAATTRTYDSANRILTASSARSGFATEGVTWTYDDAIATNYGKGRVATMTDPSGSATYAYERRGLPRKEAKTTDLNTYTLSYGYDPNGNRGSIRYPSGRLVSYTFDFADRPLSASSGVTTYVSSASYQPFGPESSLTYGTSPGTMRTAFFDQRYRPTEIKLAGGSTIYDYFYNTDAVGNITSICAASGACPTPSGAYDRVFAYDDLNRLATANGGSSLWASGTFAYDSMGNMTSATLGSTSRAFTYVLNGSSKNLPKLASVNETGPGNRTVSYDSAANETAVGSGSFTYSSRNYLASGDNFSYSYDGRGLRVSTARTGVTLFPTSLTVDPMSVNGGGSVTGTVRLNDSVGGTVVLASSNPTIASVPATVAVSAGQSSATFTVTTTAPGTDTKVVISATLNGVTLTTVLTVTTVPKLIMLSFSPRTVKGGTGGNSTGTVTLNGPAPTGGVVVTLLSGNPAVVSVPASVTVLATQTTATFTVTTTAVTGTASVDVKASYGGVDQHAALIVVAFNVQRVTPIGPFFANVDRPLRLASLSPRTAINSEDFSWPRLSLGRREDGAGSDSESETAGIESASVLAASPPGPPKRNFIYSPEMNLLAESEIAFPREKAILYEYVWFNGASRGADRRDDSDALDIHGSSRHAVNPDRLGRERVLASRVRTLRQSVRAPHYKPASTSAATWPGGRRAQHQHGRERLERAVL